MEKQSNGDQFVKQSLFKYSTGQTTSFEQTLSERSNNGSGISGIGQRTLTRKQTQIASVLKKTSSSNSGCNLSVLSISTASPKLRRSSSCQPKSDMHCPFFNIPKSSSNNEVDRKKSVLNNDVDGKKERPIKKIRLKRTGSKGISKSTLCLTQSWSLNLDRLRLIKNNSHNFNSCGSRYEISTKDSAFGCTITRNSCHEVKQFYVDKTSTEMFPDWGGSDSDADSIYEIMTPKLKRELTFVNGHAVEENSMNIPDVYGELKFKFQFMNEANEFRVVILKGVNIASQKIRKLGIYPKVYLMPGKEFAKCGEDKHDTHDPVFYETFVFPMKLTDLLDRDLKIKLYNKPGILSFSQPVGECSVHLYNYDLTSSTVIWQNLKKSSRQKDDLDDFDFSPLERNRIKRNGIRSLLCGIAGQ